MSVILSLGADPNERLTASVDWTPLALALAHHDIGAVRFLLQNGASPNLGWCADLVTRQAAAGCTKANAPTPLMWASKMGEPEFLALLRKYGAE
jgi:ankyrin repeat protein